MSVYRSYRQLLGRSILLGLELLVAADIIRTVAVTPTYESVGVLAIIVLIYWNHEAWIVRQNVEILATQHDRIRVHPRAPILHELPMKSRIRVARPHQPATPPVGPTG